MVCIDRYHLGSGKVVLTQCALDLFIQAEPVNMVINVSTRRARNMVLTPSGEVHCPLRSCRKPVRCGRHVVFAWPEPSSLLVCVQYILTTIKIKERKGSGRLSAVNLFIVLRIWLILPILTLSYNNPSQ